MAGAVWTTLLPKRLALHLPPDAHPLIPKIVDSLVYAMSFPSGSPEREGINAAYVDVQRILNILALAALGPALMSMLCMEDVYLDNGEESRHHSKERSRAVRDEGGPIDLLAGSDRH